MKITTIHLVAFFICLSYISFTSAGSEFLISANLLSDHAIIDTKSLESEYRLSETITRAELAKVSAKLGGYSSITCTNTTYTDVNNDLGDLCGFILSLSRANIITKLYSSFRPNDPVTRAEAIKMLLKSTHQSGSTLDGGFLDTRNMGDLSLYINRVRELDCIQGSHLFYPNHSASRGELFKIAACVAGYTTTLAPTKTTPPVSLSTGTSTPSTGTSTPSTGTSSPNTGTSSPSTGTSSPSTGTASAFALINGNDTKNFSSLFQSSGIDGLALQLSWSLIELQDDSYDWSALDSSLVLAKQYNKKITLHIFGVNIPPPSWLATSGAKYYTYRDRTGKTKSEPIPWDSVYLSKYSEFLVALSTHLQENNYTDLVQYISVVAPVPEMSLIACRNGSLGDGISYDRSAYLSAWKQMIDVYAKTFPTIMKLLSAPRELICFPVIDTQFFRDIMDYVSPTYGSSFTIFAADLTANGSDRTASYLDYVPKIPLGYQTIWSATNDPTMRMKGTFPTNLKQAVCKGLSHGAKYFEIYKADVENSDTSIQAAITTIHNTSMCAQ